jgi:hypothetical protein
MVYSDPVDLNIPAMGDLAVDFYLPGDTNISSPLTMHNGAFQTNYNSILVFQAATGSIISTGGFRFKRQRVGPRCCREKRSRGRHTSPANFSLMATLDRSFYEKVKDKPLRVHGSLYLTLFGDKQSTRISFADHPVIVPRVGACSARGGSTGQSYFLICYAAFRYPSVLVSYRFLQVTKDEVQENGSCAIVRSDC